MGDNFNPNNQMGGHPQQQQQQSQQQQQQQPQQQPQHPNMPMPQINRSIANNIGLYDEWLKPVSKKLRVRISDQMIFFIYFDVFFDHALYTNVKQ